MRTMAWIALVCLAAKTLAQPTNTFTGKPIFDIETRRDDTLLGIIKVELFPLIAPLHARNFDSLVSKVFYDTTAFHRVVPGFVIQGGDPNSRHGNPATWGQGNPSQPKVPAEFSAAKHLRGIVSGARKSNDINSYTSQFFICVANTPNLNGSYTIFGRVLAGMNVVDMIVSSPTVAGTQRPVDKIEMFVTRNGSNDSIPLAPQLIYPPADTTEIDPISTVKLKWNRVPDAQLYEVQVSTDSNFVNNVVIRDSLSDLTYNVVNPEDSQYWYWRVRTNNGGHFSPWSTRWFRTMGTFAGISENKPTVRIVVYPNPANETAQFKGLKAGQTVRVFDALGRQILEAKAQSEILQLPLQNHKGHLIYRVTEDEKTLGSGSFFAE